MDDDHPLPAYQSLLDVSQQPGWMLVTVRPSTFSLSLARSMARTARQALKSGRTRAVLIDLRQMRGSPTTTQRFLMGVYLAALRFPGPVAMVGNESMMDPERFGELVARSRGVHGKAFIDFNAAQQWLGKATARA
jgi:hypothetical protein